MVDVPDAWPDDHLVPRPNDRLGEKIVVYAKQWRDHKNFPASPWDDRVGSISLIPPDQPRAESDNLSCYRLRENGFLGCVLYSARDQVKFEGWPANPSILEAMNESARLVLIYQSKYGRGRNLLGQPYRDGKLYFENPGLFGNPQPFSHRGHINAGGISA